MSRMLILAIAVFVDRAHFCLRNFLCTGLPSTNWINASLSRRFMCRLSICTSKWPLRLISLVSVRLRKDPDGHAGDWLLVTPSEPRLRLANEEFRFASKLRLGLPVARFPDVCPCGHRNHGPKIDLGLGHHSVPSSLPPSRRSSHACASLLYFKSRVGLVYLAC